MTKLDMPRMVLNSLGSFRCPINLDNASVRIAAKKQTVTVQLAVYVTNCALHFTVKLHQASCLVRQKAKAWPPPVEWRTTMSKRRTPGSDGPARGKALKKASPWVELVMQGLQLLELKHNSYCTVASK